MTSSTKLVSGCDDDGNNDDDEHWAEKEQIGINLSSFVSKQDTWDIFLKNP